ncbi:MAG: Ltp family lipoprotein [Atopobiaceae bacterium]|nr:Ltp family lipoprotein [Atopobiaceae bacterium]MCI2172667.1 Ltp family lipoprotein [Atopobiaceae bacterium]MCI2206974.1 Ltp family lipoprotein [Atopobiaceae bacterium]
MAEDDASKTQVAEHAEGMPVAPETNGSINHMSPKKPKRSVGKIVAIAFAVFIAIGVIGQLTKPSSTSTSAATTTAATSAAASSPAASSPAASSPAATSEAAPAASAPAAAASPESTGSTPTKAQSNALNKAQTYLNVMAFSHDGLIDQLEYDKFSEEDATWAADNCGADWNEQAAKKAESYLNFSSFSHDGLVDQLEYDKFTPDEAEYGVTQVGL